MVLEWLLIIILHGDDFGVILKDSYTTQAECERHKQGLLDMAMRVGDTETRAYCAAREVVEKGAI